MRMQRVMRTDRRLWLLFSVILFVLFGFVHQMSEGVENKVGPTSLWGALAAFPYHWGWQAPLVIAYYAAVAAIPAVVLGWVLQAAVVAIRTLAFSGKNPNSPN